MSSGKNFLRHSFDFSVKEVFKPTVCFLVKPTLFPMWVAASGLAFCWFPLQFCFSIPVEECRQGSSFLSGFSLGGETGLSSTTTKQKNREVRRPRKLISQSFSLEQSTARGTMPSRTVLSHPSHSLPPPCSLPPLLAGKVWHSLLPPSASSSLAPEPP